MQTIRQRGRRHAPGYANVRLAARGAGAAVRRSALGTQNLIRAGAGAIAGIAGGLIRGGKTKHLRGSTTKPSIFHKAINAGPAGTRSHFKKVHKKKAFVRKFEKISPPQFYTSNETSQVLVALGKQAGGNAISQFTINDIGTLFTEVFGAANQTTRLVLDKVTTETVLYNAENTAAKVTIYDIVARYDLSDVLIQNPYTVLQQGGVDPAGGAASDYTLIGNNPFTNPRFVEFFKVEKVTTVLMLGGQTHTHKTYIAPNRVINHERDVYTNYAFGKLTRWVMIMVSGHTLVSDASDSTKISTTPCAINVMSNKKYTFHCMYYPFQDNKITNVLPTAFTGAIDYMNIYTEAAAAVQQVP